MARAGRPRNEPKSSEERVTTAVRIPSSLFDELKEAAAERDTSVNHLLVRGADHYLRRLPPLEPAED